MAATRARTPRHGHRFVVAQFSAKFAAQAQRDSHRDSQHYVHPLTIGQGKQAITLANNLTLAPMAGFTNVAFRLIAKEVGGCGLVASEMVAAIGPHSRVNQKRFDLLTRSVDAERPIAMQVYGREPIYAVVQHSTYNNPALTSSTSIVVARYAKRKTPVVVSR